MIHKDDLATFLTTEAGYTPAEAEVAASDLLVSQPMIQQAFEKWRHTGELPAFAVKEYTARRLVTEYGFHPVAALLTMDWLLTDPAAASVALKHGYDTVTLAEKEAGRGTEEIVLRPDEFAYLLRFYNRQAVEEAERQAHLDPAAIETAGRDLASRGFLQASGTEGMRPLREIADLVATCASPDAFIYTTHADAFGSVDDSRFYLTSQLVVEDAILPAGKHRLTHVRAEQLASRVCEQLHLHNQPAASGGRRSVKSTAFEQAIALARTGELAGVVSALAEGGLDQKMVSETAESLMELQSIGVFAWLQAGGNGPKQGLGILETMRGLWRLDATDDDNLVLVPAAADQLVGEINSRVAAALAILPSPVIN